VDDDELACWPDEPEDESLSKAGSVGDIDHSSWPDMPERRDPDIMI
jgi:hypothetical protein